MDGDGVGGQRAAGSRGKEGDRAEDGLSDLTRNTRISLSAASDQRFAFSVQHDWTTDHRSGC